MIVVLNSAPGRLVGKTKLLMLPKIAILTVEDLEDDGMSHWSRFCRFVSVEAVLEVRCGYITYSD